MKIILSGGLGNQMFQYALYLALKEKGRKAKLDTSLYSHIKMHNGYELERLFTVDYSYSNNSKLYNLFLRIVNRFGFYPLSLADKGDYNGNVFKRKPLYLTGYWQSERYFINSQDRVRETFIFKGLDNNTIEYSKKIQKCNSISLHIRKGDYEGLESVSGICTPRYYMNAIEYILKYVEDPTFFVFSNDIPFCKGLFKNVKNNFEYVDFNDNENSYIDMSLMSVCKHNIIANSSFSWWGAWLNANPNKIVIAPEKWVNNNELKNRTIIPDCWIKIGSKV